MDRSSIERFLGGMKGTLLTYMTGDLRENALESYAVAALPTGTQAERTEFKLYWREQIWKQRECLDRESALVRESARKTAEAPAVADPSGKRAGRRERRSKDPRLQKLRDKVREMHKAKVTQAEMCRQLDKAKEPRPPWVAWCHLSWWGALRDHQYGRSVRKWLSDAGH